jgi:hypothetical protein
VYNRYGASGYLWNGRWQVLSGSSQRPFSICLNVEVRMRKGCGCVVLIGVVMVLVIAFKQKPVELAPASSVRVDVPKRRSSPEGAAKIFAQRYIKTEGTFQVLNAAIVKDEPPHTFYVASGIVNGPGTSLPFDVGFFFAADKDEWIPVSVNYAGRNFFDLQATIDADKVPSK